MPRPGSGLVAFVTGQVPGLSEDARRGRKEVLWIAASIWLPQLTNWIQGLTSGAVVEPVSAIPGLLINAAIVAALARGRPWARTFSIVMLVPTAIAHAVVPFVENMSASGILLGLVNAGVYGAAALVLARSPRVRAYIESQQGRIGFPKAGPQPKAITGPDE
jgi:hypothetical protein